MWLLDHDWDDEEREEDLVVTLPVADESAMVVPSARIKQVALVYAVHQHSIVRLSNIFTVNMHAIK